MSALALLGGAPAATEPQPQWPPYRELVADAVRVGEHVEEGHRAVNRYCMEDRLSLVRAQTLVVCGDRDPFSFPDLRRLAERLPGSRTEVLRGLGVAAVDEDPISFARVVVDFLTAAASREGPDHSPRPEQTESV